MKRSIPYIIGTVAFLALIALLIISAINRPRKLNEQITLKQKDKIPYGFYAARNLLPSLFPGAKIYTDKRSPGHWDSLTNNGNNQAVFLTGTFNANEDELHEIMEFVKAGNHVFIICRNMSYSAADFFGFSDGTISTDDQFISKDSLRIRLSQPRFNDTGLYIYPGKRFSNSFTYTDTSKAIILGKNANGHANFLQYKAGNGYVYIHTAPLAFSNYFILHKNNSAYYQQALSVLPSTVKKVLWNEYYLYKRNEYEKEPNWLGVLFKYKEFKWAFITALVTLLLFVLFQMRRRQRIIPEITRPTNASLDFVQTIGRLYHDQKNHTDLSQKMGVYFLDHVRNKYKLSTIDLDDVFINALHAKSGYPKEGIQNIIDSILFANSGELISELQLANFHKQLEHFYQNT